MKVKFLNVDLEIKSSSRLLQIEKELEKLGVLLLFSGEVEGGYLSAFEVNPDMDTPDKVIIEFSRLIGCFSKQARKEWIEAEERVFDVGYESDEPIQNLLEEESKQIMEYLEGVVRFTTYQRGDLD